MGYPYTSTSTGAATATGLSTQILVQVDGESVGAIQNLRVSQSRSIKRVTEIGTDGVIELVPERASEVSLSVTRIAFDKKRLPEAFQRGFLNIHAQRIPFDIIVYDFQQAESDTAIDADPNTLDVASAFDAPLDANGVITTVYENCWFSSLTSTYGSDNYIISEDAEIQAEFVHSYKDGQANLNASNGNPALDDALERLADVGRRGSLDGRGLGRIADTFAGLLRP